MRFLHLFTFSIINILFLNTNKLEAQDTKSRKGQIYAYWGWNRGQYTNSDIRFWGSNYDFTLDNVVAKDRQTPFDVGIYFNPTLITIPQVNYRIGYFLSNRYDISFGVDHMKYVMQQNQIAKINGSIKQTGTRFDADYANKDIALTEDFLTFEHTDGLNFLNLELNRYDKLLDLSKFNIKNIELDLTEGISAGAMLPRTNTQLLQNARYDEFHLSGYGFGAKLGLNVTFWRHLFFQAEVKGGYINMPDIRTTMFASDRAAQHFFFLQENILFGFRLGLHKKNR